MEGFLKKGIENYGISTLTFQGKKYLDHPVSFQIVKKKKHSQEEKNTEDLPSNEEISCVIDRVLFLMMKDLRKKLSKKFNIPPYVIFQDPSLEVMATTYPITIEELQNIPGVGVGKSKRYGEEFIRLIKSYVVENEIERSEDIYTQAPPSKSKTKVYIVQNIDRKIDLKDIALAKGLEFDELLNEIESIVYSGTKINIDYFIDEIMDEDRIKDIYQYFKQSETDHLKEANQKLGSDYTEEDIRLVRIKFLSELAN